MAIGLFRAEGGNGYVGGAFTLRFFSLSQLPTVLGGTCHYLFHKNPTSQRAGCLKRGHSARKSGERTPCHSDPGHSTSDPAWPEAGRFHITHPSFCRRAQRNRQNQSLKWGRSPEWGHIADHRNPGLGDRSWNSCIALHTSQPRIPAWGPLRSASCLLLHVRKLWAGCNRAP